MASLVRIAAGIIFVAEGWGKVSGGFVHGDFSKQASGMAAKAWPFWQRLLHGFVLPNAAAIAWLVALSELAVGFGLVLGLWTRVACAGGALLVLTFLFGQSYVPGSSWDSWVTAGLTSKFAILLLLLLAACDAGRVWGLDGRARGRKTIRD